MFTSFFSYLQSIQTDIWVPHSLETKIPDMIKYDLKENCTIIAPQPTTLKETTTNIEVISATAFIDKTKIPKNKCVLFYEDIYCHGIFHKIPECSFIKNNYQYSVYKEYSYDYKDESTTYKLYLLKLEN